MSLEQKVIANYTTIDSSRSWFELILALSLYILSLSATFYLGEKHLLLGIGFALITGLSLIRPFIIMHDCGHGTFFKKKKTRDLIGSFIGMLLFTPYKQWSAEHKAHHQTSANLDRRGRGDIWTMTVTEYQQASAKEKFFYLFYRHPLVFFFIGPFYIFFFKQRFPMANDTSEIKRNVHLTTAFFILYFSSQLYFFNFWHVLIFNFAIYLSAQGSGCFLFFIQHQFEDCYWAREKEWNYAKGALQGSSYFKLPKVLQWLSGNIGFHHLHHLNHKVPFYRLEQCHYDNPCFWGVRTLSLMDGLKCLFIKFYDEKNQKMITYRTYKRVYGKVNYSTNHYCPLPENVLKKA